jgi:AraC family transcriptional regulator
LLSEGKLSISQIATESGFAHQSHLARHMRRMLGVAPKALRKQRESDFEDN